MLSHWLDEAPLAAEDEAPTLHGTTRADVCIVGGGFCGLWTAIRLKERDPALDIVIVEKNRCGGGASGRNGGFVLIDSLRKFCASDEAVRLAQASAYTMQGMADFCAANEIDFGLRPDGWLWAATNKVQDDAWLALLDDLDHHQLHTGPIDRSLSGLPFFDRLGGRAYIVYGLSFSGNGVGPTLIGAKILSSLVLNELDEWSECGLVRDSVGQFLREPLRYFGGSMVNKANRRKEALENQGKTPGPPTRYFAKLALAGLLPVKGMGTPGD